MKPLNDSPKPANNETTAPDEDIAQALSELENGITVLRQRYTDVTQAQTEKQELRVRLNRAQQELKQHRTKQLKDEVKALQTRMEEIELILESQLFAWSSFKEPFWQAVRFGGVGIVLGWFLHALN